MSSSPGIVGLARAHPLTKTQAMESSRQTWSSYGPPYPLGRWLYIIGVIGRDISNSCNVEMRPTFSEALYHHGNGWGAALSYFLYNLYNSAPLQNLKAQPEA